MFLLLTHKKSSIFHITKNHSKPIHHRKSLRQVVISCLVSLSFHSTTCPARERRKMKLLNWFICFNLSPSNDSNMRVLTKVIDEKTKETWSWRCEKWQQSKFNYSKREFAMLIVQLWEILLCALHLQLNFLRRKKSRLMIWTCSDISKRIFTS